MDATPETSSSKRQRMEDITKRTTQALADKNDYYAARKLSGSFFTGHMLNLLIESECVMHVLDNTRDNMLSR